MTQFIKKLPTVFQTVTEQKFFDATFDQVFSKKDSDLLYGYIGRRVPGVSNPITDFYLPEPSKDRTWWQLEATAFAKDENTEKTNIFFYDDLLNRINYYGGNTLNQDRLFESNYYSWAPPIDVDMFTNYQNYYWVDQGLSLIFISGVVSGDIIGQSSYTTPPTATPPNLTLTSGMQIVLSDESLDPLTVENIGECVGIRLIPQYPDFTPGTILEFLPWDGISQLPNGRIIQNTNWDAMPWETQVQPGNADYITIERGAPDRNSWSRTNKWFHIDAIQATSQATGIPFPFNANRALRPIIQFVADLKLYSSGTQFRADIDYGFRDNQIGEPIRFGDYQNKSVSQIDSELNTNLVGGELVCFFNDTDSFDFWDIIAWGAPPDDWDSGFGNFNQFIFQVNILPDNSVNFTPYTSWLTPALEGDIVLVAEDGPWDSAQRGETWYYSSGVWLEAFNDKITINQPPLFQLYDHNGISLDDPITYPLSNFRGSKIFSYKVNTTPGAFVDPVLHFPIVYTSLGQASDIIFQNNLITDRYIYGPTSLPIDGYYYYTTTNDAILLNNWNLFKPCMCNNIVPPPPVNCIDKSKQRVIDRYVVGYGTEYQFKLSVTPYGYVMGAGTIQPLADIIVSVDDKIINNEVGGYVFDEINNTIYVDLSAYLTPLMSTTLSQPPVVELHTYTHGLLDPSATGYFEIPQQLEANPNQLEIDEISGSNLSQQFASIIANQIGEIGIAFGGNNNYRDTLKNRSLGAYILQNVSPLLKTMLVSSSNDLDFITSERFSQDEYTKFKNKFLKTALQLINQGFDPSQFYNSTIVISEWVEEILKVVNVSNEFSNAFAYSYMIANGSPYATETHVVPPGGLVTLTNYIDLTDLRNALYIYDTTGVENLLIIGQDYEIVSTNLVIEIQFNTINVPVANNVTFALYKNPVPAYIPTTPSKIGTYPTYLPRLEWDVSYTIPTWVIIGHDGSKTIAYGDYRDQLLLELEKRIYNLIQYKFRHQYYTPLRVESVKSGYFRRTRYSHDEYLEITESYLNKWSAANRANYHANDWPTSSVDPLVNPADLWKLYNYRSAIVGIVPPLGQPEYFLPGNWKGIFQYYYDTYYPDTRPWEMLGFSEQPSWWVAQYGSGVINTNGQIAWPNSPAYALMWADLEYGIIRQGPSAIYDPITLLPQEQIMWARPGLSAIIPVDVNGDIIPIPTLFNITLASPLAPFDHFDDDWMYGDGSPVEQAWMSTSAYAFSIQEFLYLMKPAQFGELFWDTFGTELSPGMINDPIALPGIELPVMSATNWQYVQNDSYISDDPFFAWMRPKNKDQTVHAEIIDNIPQIRFGYQRWISDRIMFLGKDVTSTFGQKIRTLDVNLANKLAGFTNKDTTNTYIESVSPGVSSTNLLIPTNNFSVFLHKGQPIKTYSYSGVVIRALADGTFVVYGYDLLNSEFIVLDRSNAQLIDISIGGTPAEFRLYTIGETYNEGEIVRYNGVYYVSLSTQVAGKFDANTWQKLKTLPTVGGISVTYKPISKTTSTRVPYGSVLKSAQEVFDLLIGWGAYLESQGWKFEEVNQDTNMISDWLYSAKQYLFWLNTSWAPDASIQLSPAANTATLIVEKGYPDDVEIISNGVYSILDKFGVAIPTNGTVTRRDGRLIEVSPVDLSIGGIYFLQVNTSETEHILIFDNSTSFSDIIYDPLLRVRQQRLRFNGFRSNGWYGKMEAPGYLVIENQLVPNFDTIVDAMRYYYDPDVTIDNPSLEELGRHLIGYESKSYLDNLQVSNDVQYLFYQGAIRQKGTIQSFDKLFRSTKVRGNETIEVFEEWALKLGNFGNTIEQVSTEFVLTPEQNSGEVIVARLNFVPSDNGFVKQINILNAENVYTAVPSLEISYPDYAPLGWQYFSPANTYEAGSIVRIDNANGNPVYYTNSTPQGPGAFISINWTIVLETRRAKAYVILNSSGIISRVDITDPGYGYATAPEVNINSGAESHLLDKLYSVWQGEITRDVSLNNIIEIDIDDTNRWTIRPADPSYSLEFPTTNNIDYPLPDAGYVNFNDITWTTFNNTQMYDLWGTTSLNPIENDTIWVAKTFTDDWGVYKMVNTGVPFDIIKDDNNNLMLRTPIGYLITPQLSASGNTTDFGNTIALQVIEAHATATTSTTSIPATASALVPLTSTASVTGLTGSGGIAGITISSNGAGYDFIPTVTVASPATQGNGSATAVLTAGAVSNINLVSGGSGYATAPTVSIAAPLLVKGQASATISSGAVTTLTLINGGNGYITPPIVTIKPPNLNYASASSVLTGSAVTSLTLVSGGSGYTTAPSVEISPPTFVKAVATATLNSSGTITGIVFSNYGSGYATAPSVTVNPPTLTQAHATAVISGGSIVGLNFTNQGSGYITTPLITITGDGVNGAATAVINNGKVTGYVITNSGSGYTSASLSFDMPTGTGAILTSTVLNGKVASIFIVDGGGGYTSPPNITIAAPNGTQATASANVSSGSVTGFTMISQGSGYTSAPSVIVGSPAGAAATATALISSGVITGFIINSPGSGYTSAPVVTIASPPGSTATATSTISGGVITGFTITNSGGGYITPPVITIGSQSGSSTTAKATASVSTGIISNIAINDPGSGYISIPSVTIQPPAGNKTIQSINITNPGSDYITAPNVNITGDGASAAATATILDGQVVSIDVTNHGSNYTVASVSIDPPPIITLGAITEITVTQIGSGYATAPTVTITDGPGPIFGPGLGATAIAKISGGVVTEIQVVTPGSGYVNPVVTISPPFSVNPATNYAVGFAFNNADSTHNYYNLLSLEGAPLVEDDLPDYLNFTKLMLFKTMRFYNEADALSTSYIVDGDKVWIDNFNDKWAVKIWDSLSSSFNTFRLQEELINSALFQSARVYQPVTQNELAMMPVFDPFKNILPAPAKQNITYTTLVDPTQYNVTGNPRLYNANITFGEAQVGKIWWDLSNVRYVYYEQPIALDGSETPTENLVYRRDRWGQIFPGSSIDIYEWTKSSVPPAEYTGSGTPRSTTDYVQIETANKFTNIVETHYYFWVLNSTDKPNIENRTLAGIDISRLLANPRGQKFAFFAPIQQTSINNSYMFYNVQEILIWQGNNVQIQYRLGEREDQKHTQWSFFREGDTGSLVTDQFWDKLVDSLCGYTKLLPPSNEWNGLIIAENLPWDIYGWDLTPWDELTTIDPLTPAIYGEVLPVPDPALSESEKFGIEYRPRQGMFVNLYAARKIFVQSANNLLQHIPIRDNNTTWNSDVTSDTYWTYTNWYEIGFEDVIPTVIFSTLTLATAALTAGQFTNGTKVQVVDGTPDGRYVIYNVIQLNPNVMVQSFQLVAIELSAIKLLDTIYTTKNIYGLSVELRQLLNALRNEVFVNAFIIDQNELYFSMLNYVMSEQKNPDWAFKTSYIYIKENNLPLTQESLYIPNQIDNIIKYIVDAKPYHTQIRDYTSTYLTSDIAVGTAFDSYRSKTTLAFNPTGTGFWDADAWDIYGWDNWSQPLITNSLNAQTFVDDIEQFISREDVYTVPLTFYDISKKGLSGLFPYTFDFNSINLNNPQLIITPSDVVGIQVGTNVLLYGQDYYVEYNNDTTYTAYFYNDPGSSPIPIALVWFDGGSLISMNYNGYRNELVYGIANDDFVVNVDTRLPVNDVSNLDLVPPFVVQPTVAPYVGWGDVWEALNDPVVSQILIDAGGTTEIPWDIPLKLLILPNTISSKENLNIHDGPNFYRNSEYYSGTLVNNVLAPTADTHNLDVITVFIDPITHPLETDLLPDPSMVPGVIWINGERIEYRMKTLIAPDTWELRLIRRGTMGTAATDHNITIPSLDNPLIFVPNPVWIEKNNVMPILSNVTIWNTYATNPDLVTYVAGGFDVDPEDEGPFDDAIYGYVYGVPSGGLWYSTTPQAYFLKDKQGIAIP